MSEALKTLRLLAEELPRLKETSCLRASSTQVAHSTGVPSPVSVAAHVVAATACPLLHHVLTRLRPHCSQVPLAALQQLWSSTYNFELLLAAIRQW